MAITLTFDQPDAGIPAGSVDRGRTDIKSTGPIGSPRAHPVTITVGNIPTAALVDVVLLDEPPGANPLLTELAPETWQLEFDVGCWGPFRVRVTATASDAVVSSVTRRISIRSPGYHIDYPGLAERYDPNATAVPTVPSVEITEMNEGSTNRPLVDFHRQLVVAIEGGVGGGGVIPDGSITEEKLAPELSDNLLRADGTIPFTADQNAAGNTVANLGTPTAAGDAVPLSYLNASFVLSGIRTPVRLVATVPITASNTQVVDSKPTVNGDRVLLTAQPSPVDNGIFVANDAGAWLRATDADASVDMLPGVVVFVTDGTEHAESGWILATDAPIALGTSPLTYARFTGAAQLVAGAGLTKTANTVDVVAHADGSLVVSADAVQVGTLATDAQHGARGGGTQHAAAVAGGASGFLTGADKTKLDGVASGAAALTSSAPANVGTTAAVGVGTTAARADHVHAHAAQTDGTLHAAATPSVAGFQSAADKSKLDGIASGAAALSSTTPAAVAFTGTVGVGTTAARADHVHAHAAQTDGTLHAAATPSVAGFQSAADKSKLDGIASGAAALTATAPTQITVTTAAAGVETAAAKGDHVHSVSTGAPSALAVGGAQSTGSATSLARSDHQHAMPAVATTGADGFMSAADKTRLDGMATAAAALTSTAPVNVDNAAAAVGVGTTAARHDHRHTVSIGTPVALTVGGTNAQGSATSLVRSDHTHALPGVVTTGADGFASAADKTKLDGIETGAQVTSFARVQTAIGVASSPVSFNSQKITNVLNPTADQEVATKSYVDAVASGLDLKTSCRLVATTNVTASGVQVIDGVTTATGDRLLLTSQTAPATNGIYVASGVTWLRAADADVSAEVTSGLYTYITEGTANADSGWALTTNDPIVLGTTALVFTQISGAGQITAGAALTKTGNTLDVAVHGDGSIVVNADSLQIGVIATDAQHGARAGGTTHAAVIAGGASGFITGTDKTKLDGIATGAAALSSTMAALVDAATGDAGTGTTGSRIDHRHQVRVGSPVALAIGGAAADGTSNNLARADHAHAMPAAATPVSLTVAGANAAGSAATLARSDHVHALPDAASTAYVDALPIKKACRVVYTANPAPVGLIVCDGITVANGDRVLVIGQLSWQANGIYIAGAGAWARATDADTSAELPASMLVPVGPEGTTYPNTLWQMRAAAPVVLGTTTFLFTLVSGVLSSTASPNVTAAAAAVGTGNTVARQDHTHQVSSGTPVALTLAGATAAGSATTLALSDHVHALPATAAPAALTVGAASSAGVAVTLPRSDHVHAMPGAATTGAAGFMSAADKTKLDGVSTSAAALTSTAPLENTGVAAVGVATAAARGDHQHPSAWKAICVAVHESVGFDAAAPPATVDGITIVAGDYILVDGRGAPLAGEDPEPLTGELLGIFLSLGATWLFLETLDRGDVAYVKSTDSLWTYNGSQYVELYAQLSSATPTQVYDRAAHPGVTSTAARSDHVHNIATLAPSTLSVTGTNAIGTSQSLAKADHLHNIATASPTALTVGGVQAAGSSTSLARADHVHAMPGLATSSVSGFMASLDKLQFDGIKAGTPWAIAPSPAAPTAGTVSVLSSTANVSFPTAPADGDKITVLCVPGSTFNYTLTATPKAIRDPAGRTAALSATFSSFDGCITWMYSVVSSVWEVFSYYPTYAGALATDPRTNGFRLAANASDTFAADGSYSSIWLAPVNGDRIALYDIPTTTWRLFSTAALQYSLSGRSAGIPFDVFAYQTGGTVALEVQNWSSATVRATSIARRNGVWVMNADNTRRYIGTVRARSSTNYRIARAAASDVNSAGIDYWNVDNKQQTGIALVGGSTPTYAYATAAWRQAAALATAQIDVVAGIAGDPCFLDLIATATTTNATVVSCAVGIGINSTTTPSSRHSTTQIANAAPSIVQTQLNAHLVNMSPVGVTQYAWLEYGAASSSFVGINADTKHQPGMSALVWY